MNPELETRFNTAHKGVKEGLKHAEQWRQKHVEYTQQVNQQQQEHKKVNAQLAAIQARVQELQTQLQKEQAQLTACQQSQAAVETQRQRLLSLCQEAKEKCREWKNKKSAWQKELKTVLPLWQAAMLGKDDEEDDDTLTFVSTAYKPSHAPPTLVHDRPEKVPRRRKVTETTTAPHENEDSAPLIENSEEEEEEDNGRQYAFQSHFSVSQLSSTGLTEFFQKNAYRLLLDKKTRSTKSRQLAKWNAILLPEENIHVPFPESFATPAALATFLTQRLGVSTTSKRNDEDALKALLCSIDRHSCLRACALTALYLSGKDHEQFVHQFQSTMRQEQPTLPQLYDLLMEYIPL